MKPHLLSAICFSFLISSFCVKAQPGTLDVTFGDSGKVITDFDEGSACYESLLLPDGKFVLTSTVDIDSIRYTALIRYNNNGTIDSSFGTNGISKDPDLLDFSLSLALLPDGKIIESGRVSVEYKDAIGLRRFLPNGNFDSSFGENGKVATLFETIAYASDMALQSDGKIVVCGTNTYKVSHEVDFYEFSMIRYNSDGSIDSSFGNNGIVLTHIGENSGAQSIAIQSDGKLVVAGFSDRLTLVRYLTDGKLDSTFGIGGIVITPVKADISSLLLQQDGKITAVGTKSSKGLYQILMERYQPNGSVDSSFGNNGNVVTDFNLSTSCSDAALQDDGRIIVAGKQAASVCCSNSVFAVLRFQLNGEMDTSFGSDGIVTTDFPYTSDGVTSVFIQPDGKIVASGYSGGTILWDSLNIAIARYNNDIVFPVNISSFTATKQQNSVLLNWKTCSEINNKSFYVERSTNGNTWNSLGFVAAKGGGYVCNNNYDFTDSKPATGNNFYRLKQMDNDGKFTYSKTVSINFAAISKIKISPNPVKDVLKIEGLNASLSTTLMITDVSGKVVAKTNSAAETYNWNIQHLLSGTYYLIVFENNKQIISLKFIKQ